MLLEGRCDVVEAESGARGFCVVHDEQPLVAVVGEPGPRALRHALGALAEDGELVALDGSLAACREALPPWRADEAAVFVRPAGAARAERPPLARDGIPRDGECTRHVPAGDDGRARAWRAAAPDACDGPPPLAHLPRDFAGFVTRALRDRPVACAWADGSPVSFCVPAHVSESWWDVSIDTLDGFRRRGLARAAFAALDDLLDACGRRPAWGSLLANEASLRLAERLGLARAGRLWVLSHATRGPRAVDGER